MNNNLKYGIKGKYLNKDYSNLKGDQITLTTPSKLFSDYSIPDDPNYNHLLIGPFDTNGYNLTIPTGNTLIIL